MIFITLLRIINRCQVTGRKFRPGPSAAIKLWLKNANDAGESKNFASGRRGLNYVVD